MPASLLVGLALVVGAPAKKEPAAKEPPTLIGEWICATGVRGGKPEDPPPGSTMEFLADGKLKIAGNAALEVVTYKTDAKRDPAEVEITIVGGPTIVGIYKIEGDTLTLCFSIGGDRPKTFESPTGSMIMLITCKRAKKD